MPAVMCLEQREMHAGRHVSEQWGMHVGRHVSEAAGDVSRLSCVWSSGRCMHAVMCLEQREIYLHWYISCIFFQLLDLKK